jgi:uncharacterized membrane protein (UPF0136 family)
MGRGSQGSLFAAISEGLVSQEQSARLQRLEIGLGFLGFWTLLLLAMTVAATLRGGGVVEALFSALFVAMTWVVYRRWREVGRRAAEDVVRRRGTLP